MSNHLKSSLKNLLITPKLLSDSGRHRIIAKIQDQELFFEAEQPLMLNADALSTAFLLPAMHRQVSLHTDLDLDRQLLHNFNKIASIAKRWWNYSGTEVTANRLVDRRSAGEVAMFFTGDFTGGPSSNYRQDSGSGAFLRSRTTPDAQC